MSPCEYLPQSWAWPWSAHAGGAPMALAIELIITPLVKSLLAQRRFR
ncbi:hypothetical protein KDX00_08360 [Cobetia amphilecti]|nr:hypothetical protein KDX00_08360 [Cobetia litoralis]